MIRLSILPLLFLCFLVFDPQKIYASKSKPFKNEAEAEYYLTEHYNKGCHYYNLGEWRNASNEFEKVIYFFPNTQTAAEASYYLGVCYFERKEYDFANEEFTHYLKGSNHPAFFEDAVYFKFCIAEHFKYGKKKRYLKFRYFPKWGCGQDLALIIYDEVITALPNHELTIRALYSKAELLMRMGEYRECVDTYQTIIRRFPRDEIVPACYLNIAEAYFQQSRYEFQNPDILALAELNARKFSEEFPKDEKSAIIEDSVCRIRELYAKGLCDLGRFYERINEPAAAAIYYQSSVEEFPTTRIAQFCRLRLIALGYDLENEEAPVTLTEEDEEGEAREEPEPSIHDEGFDRAVPYQGIEGAEPVGVGVPLIVESIPAPQEEQAGSAEYTHYSIYKKRSR